MSEKKFYIFGDNIRGNFGEVDKPLNNTEIVDLLNALANENNYFKKRIRVISDELYCKDRKLEELGIPIECCDG